VATFNNLLAIEMEKYLSTFHPLAVPSGRTIGLLVAAVWILGGLVTLIPIATSSLQVRDIGHNSYTRMCLSNTVDPTSRALLIGFTTLTYITPGIILIFMNVHIFKFVRKRRRTIGRFSGVSMAGKSS
jgi:hypothetical protein